MIIFQVASQGYNSNSFHIDKKAKKEETKHSFRKGKRNYLNQK